MVVVVQRDGQVTWKPDSAIWICSECKTLYNLPTDVKDLAAAACCAAMFCLDAQQHDDQERRDDAADGWWR